MRDFILNRMEDSHVVKSVKLRGSYLYGTQTHLSDYDIYVIIDDSLENELNKWGTIEEDGYAHRFVKPKFDVVTMTVKQFQKLLDEHDISAIETLNRMNFEPIDYYYTARNNYLFNFKLDKWKLREAISKKCNNSWAKCHKKLTVEKDYNLRCAQKSLFHVLRMYAYGIQIAQNERVIDYQCKNQIDGYENLKELYDEIVNAENPTWEYYNEKYKPLRNKLASEFKKLCPKPTSNTQLDLNKIMKEIEEN